MIRQTHHQLFQGDARKLETIQDSSVHLILTSPPYFNIKKYPPGNDQLGNLPDFDEFISELEKVWKECFRILVKGGRLIVVIGDILLSRKQYGRHRVLPLHSHIQLSCCSVGFDNLSPIIWHKISNASHEIERGSPLLGKPYEPNAIIKNDIEYILMMRKPGSYRSPTMEQRKGSKISKESFSHFFRQIWTDIPGTTVKGHPAAFPEELATRLIKMFSFIDDTVVDPFIGTGTTMLAAIKTGRNSIGLDINSTYLEIAEERIKKCDNVVIDHVEGCKKIQATISVNELEHPIKNIPSSKKN